jgi:hypothetical protein
MTLSLINAAICLSAKANAVSAFRCREVGSAGARAGLSEVIPGRDISVQRSAFSVQRSPFTFHFSLLTSHFSLLTCPSHRGSHQFVRGPRWS